MTSWHNTDTHTNTVRTNFNHFSTLPQNLVLLWLILFEKYFFKHSNPVSSLVSEIKSGVRGSYAAEKVGTLKVNDKKCTQLPVIQEPWWLHWRPAGQNEDWMNRQDRLHRSICRSHESTNTKQNTRSYFSNDPQSSYYYKTSSMYLVYIKVSCTSPGFHSPFYYEWKVKVTNTGIKMKSSEVTISTQSFREIGQ